MNIKEFLELNAGNWFSQKTNYQLQSEKAESSKSDLTIELLNSTSTELQSFCEQAGINVPSHCLGLKTSWDNTVDTGKPKQKGSVLVVITPESDDGQTGKIYLKNPQSTDKILKGSCALGKEDEALTLIVEDNSIFLKERIWFASPNLRLRTLIGSDFQKTSFYSEIRKMSSPPKN